MQILYEFPPTRSNRAKWALEELGLDYTSVTIDFMQGQQQAPEYKKTHPLGHVPAYQTDRYLIHESVAIIMQLLDEHPAAQLAPEIGTAERAEYYQWCVFAAAELDHLLFDVMKHTMHLPEEKRNSEIAQKAQHSFTQRADILSTALNGKDYLLGSNFSGADIAIGYCCNWAEYTNMLAPHPILVSYYARLKQRPAFQKVFYK